jgi:hypothetical protein
VKVSEKVLAFIIDGVVQRVMRFDEETSAIMLSDPKIVDITNVQVTEAWGFDDTRGFFTNIDGQEVVVPL